MYRYARATRTLRAVAALLALHADELADSCIEPPEALSFLPNPPTGPAFLFDALAVRLGGGAHLCACQASCRRLRLGGGAHLCACQAFVSPRRRLPLASAFVCEECSGIKVRVARTKCGPPRRRLAVAAASSDGLAFGNACGPVAISLSSSDGLPAGMDNQRTCIMTFNYLRIS